MKTEKCGALRVRLKCHSERSEESRGKCELSTAVQTLRSFATLRMTAQLRQKSETFVREFREFSEISEYSEFKEFREFREFKEFREFREFKEFSEFSVSLDTISLNSLNSLITLNASREIKMSF